MSRFSNQQTDPEGGGNVGFVKKSSRSLANPFKAAGRKIADSRRVLRMFLVAGNLLLLLVIGFFAVRDSQPDVVLSQGVLSAQDDDVASPLDHLSSADIAVNVARVAALYETTAVTNQAQSVEAELSVSAADSSAVAKPQAVATNVKTRQDIQEYTVKDGDSVASVAAAFNITSDSIMWSNNLSRARISPGDVLVIPPINGIVYTVKQDDTTDKLAERYRSNKDLIIAFNDIELTGLPVGEKILIPDGKLPAPAVARPIVAVYGYNGYDYGFCTWYVANRRAEIGRQVPSNLGDAWTWDDRAASAGIRVDHSPAYGAAVVTSSYRRPGHVAFVEAVNSDGSVWISEMNSRGQVSMTDSRPAGGWGRVDWKLIPADVAAGLNYVH